MVIGLEMAKKITLVPDKRKDDFILTECVEDEREPSAAPIDNALRKVKLDRI